MSQQYDDEIRKDAQLFAEAETLFKSVGDKLELVRREFDEAKDRRDRMKDKLANYVGRNICRVVIKLSGGGVVVVSYEGENLITAEIHDVL